MASGEEKAIDEGLWDVVANLQNDYGFDNTIFNAVIETLRDAYTQGRADALKELEQLQREADTSHISNLEMLVVRLARHIAKLAGDDSKLVDQAFDYIKRKGVSAGTDILRLGTSNDYLSSKSKEGRSEQTK